MVWQEFGVEPRPEFLPNNLPFCAFCAFLWSMPPVQFWQACAGSFRDVARRFGHALFYVVGALAGIVTGMRCPVSRDVRNFPDNHAPETGDAPEQ